MPLSWGPSGPVPEKPLPSHVKLAPLQSAIGLGHSPDLWEGRRPSPWKGEEVMSPAGAVRTPCMSPDLAQWPLGTAPGTALTLPLGSGTPGLPQLRNPMHNGRLGGVFHNAPEGPGQSWAQGLMAVTPSLNYLWAPPFRLLPSPSHASWGDTQNNYLHPSLYLGVCLGDPHDSDPASCLTSTL